MPIAAAASHDHAGTACVLLGLSSASENGDKPSVPHGHSTSRSNGEVPRTSQQQQQPQWQGVGSHPGHPGSVHHERTVAAAIAASGEDDDLAYTGKRRTQVAALPRKEWSVAEDDLIRHGVQMLGCKWRVIAAQLPGRSDDAVRNRWSRLQESMRPPEQQQPNPKSAASLAAPSTGGGGGGSSSASDGTARQPGPPDKEADRKSAPEKKERASWDKKERTSWTRAEDDIIVQWLFDLSRVPKTLGDVVMEMGEAASLTSTQTAAQKELEGMYEALKGQTEPLRVKIEEAQRKREPDAQALAAVKSEEEIAKAAIG